MKAYLLLTSNNAKTILEDMDDKTKQDIKEIIIDVFNEGVEELIAPRLSEVEGTLNEVKSELLVLKTEVLKMETRVDGIDRKLDRVLDKVNNYDVRITHLEQATGTQAA